MAALTDPQLVAVIKKYRALPVFLGIDIQSVDQPDAIGDTMLHIASFLGARDDVNVLLSHGARVNGVGDMGFTPLHSAAMKGRLEVVELLLSKGANPNLRNEWGDTPAETAAKGAHRDVAKVLAARTVGRR